MKKTHRNWSIRLRAMMPLINTHIDRHRRLIITPFFFLWGLKKPLALFRLVLESMTGIALFPPISLFIAPPAANTTDKTLLTTGLNVNVVLQYYNLQHSFYVCGSS